MRSGICFMLSIFLLLLCGCGSIPEEMQTIQIEDFLYLFGCVPDTEDWQTIYIEKIGTIKLPNEWIFYAEDGIMYIVDGEKPVMFSAKRISENQSNAYYEDYQYVGFVSSIGLSNGAIYGKLKYQYDDEKTEVYYLNLSSVKNREQIEFVVLDWEMSEGLIDKIAKTFVSD